MSVTGGIMAGIGVAGSIGGAAISGHAANQAADTQAQAANNAAQLQAQEAQNALNFQEQQYNNSLNMGQPWVQAGQGGIANLQYLLGIGPNPGAAGTPSATGVQPGGPQNTLAGGAIHPVNPGGIGTVMGGGGDYPRSSVPVNGAYPTGGQPARPQQMLPAGTTGGVALPGGGTAPLAKGVANIGPVDTSSMINKSLGGYGSLMQGWNQQFQAPTNITEQNDPGYQARLQLGQQTMERSAAARGGLLTGGTARDENQFAQDYASNEYGNVYNRAYNNYATNYNQFEQNQANQFNRLASLSGIGQTSAGQLGQLGQSAANNVSSILGNAGAQIGQNVNNAGAARASGYVGAGNAYAGALGGVSSSLNNMLMMQQLFGSGGGGSVPSLSYDQYSSMV